MPEHQARQRGSPEGAGAHGARFSQAGDFVLRHHHAAQGQDRLCQLIDALAAHYIERKIDLVLGIEARGFIFGPALAYRLNAGLCRCASRANCPLPWPA